MKRPAWVRPGDFRQRRYKQRAQLRRAERTRGHQLRQWLSLATLPGWVATVNLKQPLDRDAVLRAWVRLSAHPPLRPDDYVFLGESVPPDADGNYIARLP